jgi:hypothetical protein
LIEIIKVLPDELQMDTTILKEFGIYILQNFVKGKYLEDKVKIKDGNNHIDMTITTWVKIIKLQSLEDEYLRSHHLIKAMVLSTF